MFYIVSIAQLTDLNILLCVGETVEATFGQQIRNYVFAPYKLVKDTRTMHETSQVQDVLDGDFDSFIEAYLRALAEGKIAKGQGVPARNITDLD
ncbi:hypothetical protein EON65_32880 [archaeon]|nr:MAG: hypothetical protein EON65_32880 [archaeon]